jgi:hypothetical protein
MFSSFPTCEQAQLQPQWCMPSSTGEATSSEEHPTEEWLITKQGNLLLIMLFGLMLVSFAFLALWSATAFFKTWRIHGSGWQPFWMRCFHATQFLFASSQVVAMAVSLALCLEIRALVDCCRGLEVKCVPLLPVGYFTMMFVALMISWGGFFSVWSLTMSYWAHIVNGYSRCRTRFVMIVVSCRTCCLTLPSLSTTFLQISHVSW